MNGDLYYTDQKISYDVGESQAAPEGNTRNWEYVPSDMPTRRVMFSVKMKGIDGAPQKIKQLVQMFEEEPWLLMRKKSFYEQTLLMADYEDDVEIVPFSEYFPVYRSMDIAQLRSYFTFRKFVRKGEYPVHVTLAF